MSKQLKGVGVWLIVLVLMIAGLSYLGEKLQTQNNYSYKETGRGILKIIGVAEAVIQSEPADAYRPADCGSYERKK